MVTLEEMNIRLKAYLNYEYAIREFVNEENEWEEKEKARINERYSKNS